MNADCEISAIYGMQEIKERIYAGSGATPGSCQSGRQLCSSTEELRKTRIFASMHGPILDCYASIIGNSFNIRATTEYRRASKNLKGSLSHFGHYSMLLYICVNISICPTSVLVLHMITPYKSSHLYFLA